MADEHEKYFWLVWTIATSMLAFYYFPFTVTIAFFISGIMISSKCLIEDFINLKQDDEKQNEKNH
ncbi:MULTISPECIES: hypothetical protein [Mesobacillus]|uniref:hypothetical protein n=1 Tax=Mesobacillus TaxID=2675231 RepID=UPI00177AAD8E|nr:MULTISPECIES: hypothetical protein [Mesobacillus]MCM3574026.1 hypothetical protein [Mesobacillus subterraneus]UYZ20202.1 hypothetical protein FOF60_14030 [Mesobacillus jeotgali]